MRLRSGTRHRNLNAREAEPPRLPAVAAARCSRIAVTVLAGAAFYALASLAAQGPVVPNHVVVISLDDTIEPVTAEYVEGGIRAANERHASAVLLELSTPGGLDTSMREIIRAVIDSRAPVITYVAPSGSRAASAAQ